jgi:hypothetical protein
MPEKPPLVLNICLSAESISQLLDAALDYRLGRQGFSVFISLPAQPLYAPDGTLFLDDHPVVVCLSDEHFRDLIQREKPF